MSGYTVEEISQAQSLGRQITIVQRRTVTPSFRDSNSGLIMIASGPT